MNSAVSPSSRSRVPACAAGPPAGEIQIEPALLADHRAARLLLGESVHHRLRPYTLVARAETGVVAAAALFIGPLNPVPGVRIAISVAEPFRRRGVATRLIERASAHAQSKRAQALYAPGSISPGSEEHAAWQRLGFTSVVKEILYEAKPQSMVELLGPLCARMRKLGRIPEDARVISLREAPHACVADLHARYLGGHALVILARIEGDAPGCYDVQNSRVLMVRERVGGFLLMREIEEGVGMTEATVVIPELRQSWANVLLKASAAERSVRLGRRASRFLTYDQHADTRRFARMVRAKVTKTAVIPYRVFERGEPETEGVKA